MNYSWLIIEYFEVLKLTELAGESKIESLNVEFLNVGFSTFPVNYPAALA